MFQHLKTSKKPSIRILSLLVSCGLMGPALAANPIPEPLIAEWLSGEAYPAEYFDIASTDFRKASTGASRLLIRKDGTYERAELRTGATPGYFGSLLIACETIDLVWEKGTASVKGNQILLHPTSSKSKTGATPFQHNNGCMVFAGIESTRTPADRTLQYTVQGGSLRLTSGETTSNFNTRAPAVQNTTQNTAQNSTQSKLSAQLQGEWYSGTISPMEYYNSVTGLWTHASGTSTLLKMNADGSYTKTGLLVITTFSCTSKVFVQEEGKVVESGEKLTFTPSKSLSQGYTCSPSNSYEQRDTAKPSTVTFSLENPGSAKTVLSLGNENGVTRFNRSETSAPTNGTANTGNTSNSAPLSQNAQATKTEVKPQIKPIRTDGSGNWKAILRAGSESMEVTLTLDEDDRGLAGTIFMGNDYVGYVRGDRNTGTLQLVLNDDDETTFNATGTFEQHPENLRYPIDRFFGEFSATNLSGEQLGTGTLELLRPE
ncbi:hypothetical protein [Deinococcus roseus]|uniref:META domain-containing protein n=1 Tax=Deinococcus roseus TaxID=392414 RepID=A0ABQ2D0T2_9DEIO|nr:hypothetical protein [Deinococcus roseus]GGJ39531.1 hypothetical protein GCM10008938_27000 [Deinococcus roseus]